MNTTNPRQIGIQATQLGGSFSEIGARDYFYGNNVEIVPYPNHKSAVHAFRTHEVSELFIPVENSTSGRVLEWVESFDDAGLGKRATIAGAYLLKVEQCLLVVEGMNEKEIEAVTSMKPAIDQTRDYTNSRDLVIIDDEDTLGAAIRVKESGGLINGLRTAAIASRLAGITAGLVNLGSINDENSNTTRFWHIVNADLRTLNGSNIALTFSVPETRQGLLRAMRVFKRLGYSEIDLDSHLRSNSGLRHSFYGEFLRPHHTADPKALVHELGSAGVDGRVLGLYTPKDTRGNITINTKPNKIHDPAVLDMKNLNVTEGATVLYIDADNLIDVLECLKITNIHDICRPKAPTGKDFSRGYYISLVHVPQSIVSNAVSRLTSKQLPTTTYVIKNGKLHR